MATPTGFIECNTVLTAPQGMAETCDNLPIVQFPGFFTGSVWELSEEEKEMVLKTGKILLCVSAGGVTQPPVFLTPYVPGMPKAIAEARGKKF